ncbi:hypothetical protein CYMTET_55908 [Cymbomonas tetramitiformis]|uniref:Uncharacterized protein n=1 Tax=Cymbomonas tetramitiformis TaxID=36881 RepID=A0AAE0BD73_9CHLO|nr:hypothetical protein CYMTET_55908 [Cymbomonas tetramitiformis]
MLLSLAVAWRDIDVCDQENSAESKNLSTAIMANKPLAALICTAMLSSVNEAPTDPAIFPWLLCEVFDSESEGRLAWVVAHAAMTIPSVTVVDLLNYAEAGTLEIGVPTRRLQKIAGVLEFLAERAADQVAAAMVAAARSTHSASADRGSRPSTDEVALPGGADEAALPGGADEYGRGGLAWGC